MISSQGKMEGKAILIPLAKSHSYLAIQVTSHKVCCEIFFPQNAFA